MIKVFLIIILMFLSIIDVKANSRESMRLEISSVEFKNNELIINGWGIMRNAAHQLDNSTHAFTLHIYDSDGKLVDSIDSKLQNSDVTSLFKYAGTRFCNPNEYYQTAEQCNYYYKNSGFKFNIDLNKFVIDKGYYFKISLYHKQLNRSYSEYIYYPLSDLEYEYGRVKYQITSGLYDNQIKVLDSAIKARDYPISGQQLASGTGCSYSYQNKLYFAENAVFNKIYQKRYINQQHYYQIGINAGKCNNLRKEVHEGNYQKAWIGANFIDYMGTKLTLSVNKLNNPPKITIKEHPHLFDDEYFYLYDYVIAMDEEDGNLTSKIQIENGKVERKPGKYELDLIVYDSDGASGRAKLIVNVYENNNYPIIKANDVTIFQYSQFNALDYASAYDRQDGDLTHKLRYYSYVNTDKLGTYLVNYFVIDSDGYRSSKAINVNVISNPNAKIRYINPDLLFYKENIPLNWYNLYDRLQFIINSDRILSSVEIP